jgi:hypothetical protein
VVILKGLESTVLNMDVAVQFDGFCPVMDAQIAENVFDAVLCS